jgi:hypothetical protein
MRHGDAAIGEELGFDEANPGALALGVGDAAAVAVPSPTNVTESEIELAVAFALAAATASGCHGLRFEPDLERLEGRDVLTAEELQHLMPARALVEDRGNEIGPHDLVPVDIRVIDRLGDLGALRSS